MPRIFLVVFVACVLCSPVSACLCGSERSPCEVMGESSAVFLGTVKSIHSGGSLLDYLSFWMRNRSLSWKESRRAFHEHVQLTFSVGETFHGPVMKEANVHITRSSASCGFESRDGDLFFKAGEQYLVYSFFHNGSWQTNRCSRTRNARGAEPELVQLRKKAALPASQIMGKYLTFSDKKPVPISGMKITLVHPTQDKSISMSAKDGTFEFSGLKPGAYKLQADTAPGKWIGWGESGSCRVADMWIPCNPSTVHVMANSCRDVVISATEHSPRRARSQP